MKRACVLFLLVAVLRAAPARYRISDGQAKGPGSPPLVLLHDDQAGVEAAIAPVEGGELSGFRVRFRGGWVETLYRARDYTPQPGWRGKAPFLWPATGRSVSQGEKTVADTQDGGWFSNGKRYPMGIHGFVKDMPWHVERRGADESGARVILSVRDNPETRTRYPFGYKITVEYELSGGALSVRYAVSADSANRGAMPFSAGNHITFRAPLIEGSQPEQMRVTTPSMVELMKEPPGLPNGKSRLRSLAGGIALGELEQRSAVSLSDCKKITIAL